MDPPNFDMKMLHTLTSLLPKLQGGDASTLYPLIERELESLSIEPLSPLLQDQLAILSTLAHLAKELRLHHHYFRELDQLIRYYLEEACQGLSQPTQDTLEQQITTLQQLLQLRQQIDVDLRQECLDDPIRQRLSEVDSLLTAIGTGEVREQLEIVNALVDLDATLKRTHWSFDCIRTHIEMRLDELRPDIKMKEEEDISEIPKPKINIFPIAHGHTLGASQPSEPPPATTTLSPLQALYAERARRLEGQEQQQRIADAAEARAKARARREAVAADPTKAEQRKYAEAQKAVKGQTEIQRNNIRATIADDRARMKERKEQERLARMAEASAQD